METLWQKCLFSFKAKNVEGDYSIRRIGHILDRSEPQSLGKLEDPVKKHMVSIKQPLSSEKESTAFPVLEIYKF